MHPRHVLVPLAALLATASLALPAAPAAVVPLAMTGCEYVEIAVRIEPGMADALVPDDFVVRAAPTATLLMGGAECADARTTGEQGPAKFGWSSIVVEPPEDPVLQGQGVAVFLYRIEHFVMGDDVYRHVSDASGAEHIELDVLDADLDLPAATLDMRNEDLQHTILGPVSHPGVGLGFGDTKWREFHDVGTGYSMLEATLSPGPSGRVLPGLTTLELESTAGSLTGPLNVGQVTRGPSFGVLDGHMTVLPYSEG